MEDLRKEFRNTSLRRKDLRNDFGTVLEDENAPKTASPGILCEAGPEYG
jgi:hypothetical protein